MRIIIVVLFAIVSSGCYMEPITLNPAPATENFVRFKIDGRVFESYTPFIYGVPPRATLDSSKGWVFATLTSDFEDNDTNRGSLKVILPSFEPGTYTLMDTIAPELFRPISAANFEIGSQRTLDRGYQVLPSAPGVVRITAYDKVAKLLKGTFTLTGELIYAPQAGTWPIHITLVDGEFDFRGESLVIQ